MFGITAFSEDTYSSLANTFSGVASITGSATVTATSYGQFVYGRGVISGTGNLVAIGGFTATGEASITGTADLHANTSVTYSASSAISGTGDLIADGHIQGNNWTDVPVCSNIWLRIG